MRLFKLPPPNVLRSTTIAWSPKGRITLQLLARMARCLPGPEEMAGGLARRMLGGQAASIMRLGRSAAGGLRSPLIADPKRAALSLNGGGRARDHRHLLPGPKFRTSFDDPRNLTCDGPRRLWLARGAGGSRERPPTRAAGRGVAGADNHRNPQNRARAAALLRHLKGQLVDVTGVAVDAQSNVFAAAEAYWQLSKASGVNLDQEGGGWHADLEFKGRPAGIPAVVGTPAPVPTRAQAI